MSNTIGPGEEDEEDDVFFDAVSEKYILVEEGKLMEILSRKCPVKGCDWPALVTPSTTRGMLAIMKTFSRAHNCSEFVYCYTFSYVSISVSS